MRQSPLLPCMGWFWLWSRLRSHELHQQAVQAPHVVAGIRDLALLSKLRLVEEQLRQLAEILTLQALEPRDERMVEVDLQTRLARRQVATALMTVSFGVGSGPDRAMNCWML